VKYISKKYKCTETYAFVYILWLWGKWVFLKITTSCNQTRKINYSCLGKKKKKGNRQRASLNEALELD
jgi:hypothetical protein